MDGGKKNIRKRDKAGRFCRVSSCEKMDVGVGVDSGVDGFVAEAGGTGIEAFNVVVDSGGVDSVDAGVDGSGDTGVGCGGDEYYVDGDSGEVVDGDDVGCDGDAGAGGGDFGDDDGCDNPWELYIDGVLSGDIVVGVLMRRCVDRFLALRADAGITFRVGKVRKVIAFFGLLRHFTGRHAGRAFKLELWQTFVVAYIYGFYRGENRLVRRVYIEMARKNGKTAFVSGLSLYALLADDEDNAEVDLAANSRDQARIAFEFCENFARGLDRRGRYILPRMNKIFYRRKLSKLQVFAADDSKLDGFNASFFLVDEYHAAKNPRVMNALQSSQGMRENPLGIIITTAGYDKLGPCYQYRTMCVDVVCGVSVDDSLGVFIFAIDADDDWRDAGCWGKSNPNLGVTVSGSFIEQEVKGAENMPTGEIGVRTKTINEWCDSAEVWIPDHYILAGTARVDVDDFADCECYGGVDLNSTTDLAAFALCFPRDGKYYFKVRYYLPQESLNENRFKELYGDWYRRGYLILTPGNVTDYDYILDDLKRVYKKVVLMKVAYDAWNATQFVSSAIDQGMPMEAFSQTLGNFNRPTKEIERLLLSGRAVIDDNEINRHCFRNVTMAIDRNGNTKPTKQYSEKKIDGVIAMLEALGVCISSPNWSCEI